MAASTDTIQILLRQRQELRQALLDLREEIETLYASSLDLVNKNIKSQKVLPIENNKPLEAADTTKTATSNGRAESIPKLDQQSARPGKATSEKQKIADTSVEKNSNTTFSAQPEDRPKPQMRGTSNESIINDTVVPSTSPRDQAVKEGSVEGSRSTCLNDDSSRLLESAKNLSDFYLEHPSGTQPAQLAALDVAISSYEDSESTKSQAAYHSLQSAYRAVASQSYESQNINGTTLIDSRNGASVLWILPLCIAALVLIVFPLLLFSRTMATEMFITGFATNLVWVFGASSAFLWGTVGALTMLTLTIALLVRRREYDANIRYSSALQGALGGLIGSCSFLLLETWLPTSSVVAEFGLNLAAFVVGMAAGIIFATLHRVTTMVICMIEPDKK